ncbi:MAG TPA: ATP-dependent RecD-like DNA helicase [Solirubrobacterales bacterium]|nr:ATP-dependent RecD-like DNA helicase [Solirubrobacterales bacterium]
MSDADTLFEVEGGSHSATVEVLRVIFRADDGSYAVLEVEDAESRDRHPLIGPIAHLNPGDRAEVSGDWQNHATYGRQLRAQRAVPLDPEDRRGRVAYLKSLRHIGPARAERLVEEHGEEVMAEIAAEPTGVFGSLPGMTTHQVDAAVASWHESRAIRDLHVQLAPHGLAHLAAAIHARFEDQAMTVLHENPYRLTEVQGVGFARADKIALANDVPPESPKRAQAAAFFALAEAEQSGSTFLPLPELTEQASKLLGVAADSDVLAAAPGLEIEEGNAYRKGTLASEIAVAETLLTRLAAPPHLQYEPPATPPADEEHSKGLAPEQWAAVTGAFASRISVVTGGPGVGKTMCTTAIVGEAARADLRIALCAPTGRAARRLEEATAHEAQTIHRMLEWAPGSDPKFKLGHPLPVDLVVVDEASMLNLRTIEVLLDALAESTHVVFVGDADQLPPIGAGKPFDDLIASGAAPTVRLTEVWRQAKKSMIITAAHSINQGQPPGLEPGPDQEHDFFFVDRVNPERARDTAIEMVAERIPERYGLDPIREVQVLAPMYRGPVGIDVLNERLQARLNPDGKAAVGERFRVGDRLIQTRNAHDLGLMNGSIVFLREDDPDEEAIAVDVDEGGKLELSYDDAADLRLAYAISVHKAQGCEVPIVVTVCHRSHARMLTRPLIYTAVTRARRACVVIGEQAAMAIAVERDDSGSRHSGLAPRLRDG